MDNNRNLNLEPLRKFLSEDIKPKDLSQLLDEFIADYSSLVIQHQESGNELNENIFKFVYYLRELRDLFLECE